MSAYSSLVLGDGPRGYWRLGEAGYPINDSTANGLNFASGSHGGASIGFSHASLIPSDPANGAVVFPVGWLAQGSNLAAVDVRDVFTMEAWVQLLQLVNTAGQTVYTNWYGTNCMRINTANKLELWADYYGPVVCASTVAINDLLPHHVVVTKNGSAVHLYMDGVDVTGTVTNYTFTSAPGWMGIGTDASGASGNPANMVMDEVAIYPVALSQAQVLAHYHSGTGFVATVFAPVRPIRLKTSAGWADLIQVGVPTPVVNGQWIKGVGGAAVWSAITPADVPGVEVTANKDQLGGYVGVAATGAISLLKGDVTGRGIVKVGIVGDTQPRVQMASDGSVYWGPGGSTASDTSLARTASGVLRTDGTLDANALTVNGVPVTPLPPRLGTTGISITDANLAINNGWYYLNSGQANTPTVDYYALFVIQLNGPGNVNQIAYAYSTGAIYYRRYKDGTTWFPWMRSTSARFTGYIAGDGSIIDGSGGYTVTHPSTGLYVINLATAISGYPVCVVTPTSVSTVSAAQVVSGSQINAWFTTPSAYTDSGFNFVIYSNTGF